MSTRGIIVSHAAPPSAIACGTRVWLFKGVDVAIFGSHLQRIALMSRERPRSNPGGRTQITHAYMAAADQFHEKKFK
ncbi:hypothetical protein [Burkholderia anthina]|uniref:hypothetical protein n=1 Tax=Burkholderia anthina TaxID=179879 RepID=UPI00158A6938|nr:hypothetical protein [Burkholderia anthina]